MFKNTFSKILNRLLKSTKSIWQVRTFWLRALICWAFGLTFLASERGNHYDLRFQIRGPQLQSEEIYLVLINENEWSSTLGLKSEMLSRITAAPLTDSFFWHQNTWYRLLKNILSHGPKSIGVSFFFGNNIGPINDIDLHKKVFEDPKIIWAARLDTENRVQNPRFAKLGTPNVGIAEMLTDADGIVRRYIGFMDKIPHFSIALEARSHNHEVKTGLGHDTFINFQGPPLTFKTLSFEELLNDKIPDEILRDKIIIIGTREAAGHETPTPLGLMSKTEILANIADNLAHEKEITVFRWEFYAFLLALLVCFSIWLIIFYPQTISTAFLVCTGAVLFTSSLWFFDAYYIWFPVLSPSAQIIVTYFVFMSHQLAVNEQKAWELEKEKKYIQELEQLKTNFVSLISHDLKTPIAKIQAIADRLLRTFRDKELTDDLSSLRDSSNELHKYIQTILKITQVEARSFHLKKEPTDVNGLIEDVIEKLDTLARNKEITIQKNLDPLFSVELDPTMIQEVISNLIENAIKYTPSGGNIYITSKEIDDDVMVIVKDTGVGVSEEEINRIWEKFYRGKKHDLTTKGTGIGLYLVKYFVELHGGNVFLRSKEGHGTEIGFSIPIETEEPKVEV